MVKAQGRRVEGRETEWKGCKGNKQRDKNREGGARSRGGGVINEGLR